MNLSVFEVNYPGVPVPPAISNSYWDLVNLTLNSPYEPGSGSITYSGLPLWCGSTDQTLQQGPSLNYYNSSMYPYTDVPPGILYDQSALQQVAWIMNNIFVGETSPDPTATYTWNNVTYPGGLGPACSGPITAGDYQQAMWILVTDPLSTPQPAQQCRTNLYNPCDSVTPQNPNGCNVAFILDAAFSAVPRGNNYTVSSSTCGGVHPHIPVVVQPSPSIPSSSPIPQPLIMDVDLIKWGANCTCASGPTGPPGGAPLHEADFAAASHNPSMQHPAPQAVSLRNAALAPAPLDSD